MTSRGAATVGGLATRAWLPEQPRAVLVERTPYGAAARVAEAAGWADHGVGLVVQDVRGRHGSPGAFHPYAEAATDDGPTLLRWVRDRVDAPVVLLGTSYGAHAALATATAVGPGPDAPEGVVVMVPALGLGETARTRGGVLQLASRLGWWLAHDVRRPWADVVTARRRDADRAAEVGALRTPLLAIGGAADHFGHDTVDLWSAWGGPARLALGPWDHGLTGARRAGRVLAWLDAVLAGTPPDDGTRPPLAVVHVDGARPTDQWCASLRRRADGVEVAHGAARGGRVELGPVLDPGPFDVHLATDDFPRCARAGHPARRVPEHRLEIA
ncbi:CocE/NonD family hydrolase [Nocardioides litoris]|uniref:CocE/NonD family hydrolase n=1 Tax=Nocardioides litoris TaxID=1926648 RepID=UPI00111E29F6|nr:CocE/NonD family hydrolase [Nocardioides litoris]